MGGMLGLAIGTAIGQLFDKDSPGLEALKKI
jgi:hypothetical protein